MNASFVDPRPSAAPEARRLTFREDAALPDEPDARDDEIAETLDRLIVAAERASLPDAAAVLRAARRALVQPSPGGGLERG